jgi:nitroreductase
MNEIVEFLKVRRSVIIKNIVPGDMPQADLDAIIECGLRVPDHAVIGPWQIKVIQGDARSRLGRDILAPEFAAQHKEATPTMLAFESR